MTTYVLVRFDDGDYGIQADEPSQHADFSLYDDEGGGSGSPFDLARGREWTAVLGVPPVKVVDDDADGPYCAVETLRAAVGLPPVDCP